MAGTYNNIHCEQGGEPDTTSRTQDDILSTGKYGGMELLCQEHRITYIVKEFKKPDTDPGSLNDVHAHHEHRDISTKAGTQNNIHCTICGDAGDWPGTQKDVHYLPGAKEAE